MPGPATYVGSARCAACHQKEAEAWEESQHTEGQEYTVRYVFGVDPRCWRRTSTMPTVSSAARSTTTAPSCRAR